MSKYKYPFGSVWLSHSSMSDFEKCPRLYYLRNMYKEKKSGKKIQVVSPHLTLGMAVHDTLEAVRYLPRAERFDKPLIHIFEEIWVGFEGKKGGFATTTIEEEFKARGVRMIKRVSENPGPLANLSTIIKEKGEMVASMMLDPENNLILCGNVDWVEVLPDGSLHIIDFKTGMREENDSSFQLQIYLLLSQHGNKRPVTKTSYWYLEKDNEPKEIAIPEMTGVVETLIEIGKKVKSARENIDLGGLDCPKGGCRYCREYEEAAKGLLEMVGYDEIREKVMYFPAAI